MAILLGPAGNASPGILNSIKALKELELDAQEVEFVQSVRMGLDLAKEAGDLAKELNIKLSVHAPFFVNLISEKPKVVAESKIRILKACERAHYLGAKFVVFHPGFYGKMVKEEAYQGIKEQVLEMNKEIRRNSWNVLLAPETMGKKSQFGSLNELIRLSKETGCSLCVDFAHLLARHQKINYKEIFDKLKELNLKELHCHYSGIEYTEKGERRHLLIDHEETKKLLEEANKQDYTITIICEAPNTWEGSLEMKKIINII